MPENPIRKMKYQLACTTPLRSNLNQSEMGSTPGPANSIKYRVSAVQTTRTNQGLIPESGQFGCAEAIRRLSPCFTYRKSQAAVPAPATGWMSTADRSARLLSPATRRHSPTFRLVSSLRSARSVMSGRLRLALRARFARPNSL